MTDKEFQKLINKTLKSRKQYFKDLKLAEKEYQRRYGHQPYYSGDVVWNTAMRYTNKNKLSVKDVEKGFKANKKLRKL